MAQILHNISFPNDGLGDELRAAFDAQNQMNTELYNTKVDKVIGKDLSENNFTNAYKTKLDNLSTDAEKNVQSDWNELDPTSDSFILGKPIFGTDEINVSAIWKNGLTFAVTADAFPINGVSYPANPADVTLDASDPVLYRIDLIVAIKPISPATVGEVGFIKGTPATTALVVPPDYDPSLYYVIKQVIIRAAATQPEGVSTTTVYDEGVEWGVTSSANIAETTNDPSVNLKSLEATNNVDTDNALFEAPAPIPTEDFSLLTFDFKLKQAVSGKAIYIEVLLAGVLVKKYSFFSGQNGFDETDLDYQTISIDKSKLSLPLQDFDQIRIRPFWASTGYFIDNVVLHTGSGSETIPQTGIDDAPSDGKLYGRKEGLWGEVVADNLPVNTITPTNYTANGTLKSHLQGLDLALGNIQLTSAGILTRIFFTGDTETTTEGTFYLSSPTGKGAVANVQQYVSNGDNTKSFFTQDILSPETLVTSKAIKGGYTGRLDVQTANLGGGNDYEQRFTVEIYLADSEGDVIDSGLASETVGDLGVKTLLVLDSGVLDLQINSKTNILLTGALSEDVDITTGQRIRYHISAEKIGTAGAAATQSLFLGSDNNSFYEIPTPITIDSVQGLRAELDLIKYGNRIVNSTVTGAYALDHEAGNDWKITLTGDTTFSDSNLPDSTKTKEFTIKMTGDFVPTFPAYWDLVGDAYDGTVWNFIAVQIHDGNSGTEEVTAFLTNLI